MPFCGSKASRGRYPDIDRQSCLDWRPRVGEVAGYGAQLVASLPPMRRTRALEDVQRFFAESALERAHDAATAS